MQSECAKMHTYICCWTQSELYTCEHRVLFSWVRFLFTSKEACWARSFGTQSLQSGSRELWHAALAVSRPACHSRLRVVTGVLRYFRVFLNELPICVQSHLNLHWNYLPEPAPTLQLFNSPDISFWYKIVCVTLINQNENALCEQMMQLKDYIEGTEKHCKFPVGEFSHLG